MKKQYSITLQCIILIQLLLYNRQKTPRLTLNHSTMAQNPTDKIKRSISTFGISAICINLYAHAGFAERHQELAISINALTGIAFITHIVFFLAINYLNIRILKKIKLIITQFATTICDHKWLSLFAGWLLSTLSLSTYLLCICNFCLALFFIPLLLLFWLVYFFLVMKKRNKFLTGAKALTWHLTAVIGQSIGYIIYILVYETVTFRSIVHYTDKMYDIKIYPGMNGVTYMLDEFLGTGILFLIPYIILLIGYCLRYIYCKFKPKSE
ncbi:MAG: hypothetical protein J6S96_07060 [Muribaculaceae bacterium]|nr:hypothetical protein [Muribaculaceae bacterium]